MAVSLLDERPALTDETARLESFQDWPKANIVSPRSLASAGFYYLKHADNTQCAFCHGVVGEWVAGDDPDQEHVRHFPFCPYVQTVIRPRLDPHTDEHQPSTITANVVINMAQDLRQLGINVHEAPKQSEYAAIQARLDSFSSWPEHLNPTPESLANAGFYYSGITDHVFCFSCGGGVFNWDPDDDPWVEHAKWYPKCNYLLLVKGEDFVGKVSKNKVVKGTTATCNEHKKEETHNSTEPKLRKKSLEEENRLLKDARLCKICLDNESNVIFLPCRHLVVCTTCAPNLTDCPICRSSIKASVKAYFS